LELSECQISGAVSLIEISALQPATILRSIGASSGPREAAQQVNQYPLTVAITHGAPFGRVPYSYPEMDF